MEKQPKLVFIKKLVHIIEHILFLNFIVNAIIMKQEDTLLEQDIKVKLELELLQKELE